MKLDEIILIKRGKKLTIIQEERGEELSDKLIGACKGKAKVILHSFRISGVEFEWKKKEDAGELHYNPLTEHLELKFKRNEFTLEEQEKIKYIFKWINKIIL